MNAGEGKGGKGKGEGGEGGRAVEFKKSLSWVSIYAKDEAVLKQRWAIR